MRIPIVLPLALAVLALGGCREHSEETEQAALGVSERDLPLQQPTTPEVSVASSTELGLTPSERPRAPRPRRVRQPVPAPIPVPAQPDERDHSTVTAVATPVAADTQFKPVPLAPDDLEAPDPHALPPGRSVTVIPASAGPSTDGGWTDAGPSRREGRGSAGGGPHGGGGCKPRGPGRMPGTTRPGAFR
jgi:hypothetical protein